MKSMGIDTDFVRWLLVEAGTSWGHTRKQGGDFRITVPSVIRGKATFHPLWLEMLLCRPLNDVRPQRL